MKRYLVFFLMLCAWMLSCRAEADTLFIADTAVGGNIILQQFSCQAPLDRMHHYVITRAGDGMVVASGCWYLSKDQHTIEARDGATLYPLAWPVAAFRELNRK